MFEPLKRKLWCLQLFQKIMEITPDFFFSILPLFFWYQPKWTFTESTKFGPIFKYSYKKDSNFFWHGKLTLKVRILPFLTTFAQLSTRLKNFVGVWLLVLGMKEGLVECATVCVKSVVILLLDTLKLFLIYVAKFLHFVLPWY